MLNWLKSLFDSTPESVRLNQEYEKYNAQFEAFHSKLVELVKSEEVQYGPIRFEIGSYRWKGGWLINSYYFDVYPIKETLRSRYMGRIYVSNDIYGKRCRLNIHRCDKNHKVTQEKIFFEDELLKEHLTEAITIITENKSL